MLALRFWLAALSCSACADQSSLSSSTYGLAEAFSPRVEPTASCASITADLLDVAGLRVAQAVRVAAKRNDASDADNYPAHCLVSGVLDERTGSDGRAYAIGFELRMPMQWNHRFVFQGGGSADGVLLPALGLIQGASSTGNALTEGYAVVSTDAGHTSENALLVIGGALFGLDPQARLDYGYNAIGKLTSAAKHMVERVYGSAIERSYFIGCGGGGRQAMVAAARFADQFDGIVAGDPGLQLPKAGLEHAWDYQQLFAVEPDNPSGVFSDEELAFIGDRINDKCDALDGASDGMVHDIEGCDTAFDLERDVPGCAGTTRTGKCLTALQKRALQMLKTGVTNSQGESLYSSFPWDPGIGATHSTSWRAWRLGFPDLDGASHGNMLGAAETAYVFMTPPVDLASTAGLDPLGALRSFLQQLDFDRDGPKIFATSGQYTESAMDFLTPPDSTQLEAFAAKRAKLIVYHGAADPVFSANDTLRWYKELTTNVPDARDFARLFLVPGMGHCGAGPATSKLDAFGALVDWVERDQAPDAILGHMDPANDAAPAGWSTTRTRPLCAYPQHAVLRAGASDLESAASFECRSDDDKRGS